MIAGNYEKVLEKIAGASGLEKEEIERRVEAKRAKLSGLISKEGAAQVIAAELGISFDNEVLKIEELLSGMKRVNTVGKVINVFPVRTFVREGKENKVVNLVVADETSNVRVVLWDTNHIGLIEEGKIKEGVVVEIANGSMRGAEIHLGGFSEIKLSDKEIGEVKTERVVKEKQIVNFAEMENVKTRAFIVQSFPVKFFEVCPECKKKLQEDKSCKEHGKIEPEKRALITIVLDDGTETMRGVIFHENLAKLGLTELDDAEKLSIQKEELLGREMIFSGQVRKNSYFNNLEFIINEIQEVKIEELIKELEN